MQETHPCDGKANKMFRYIKDILGEIPPKELSALQPEERVHKAVHKTPAP